MLLLIKTVKFIWRKIMASSMIHICVANEINKVLKRNNKAILIGSIAPDISKLLNQTKEKSHFLDNADNNIPNMKRFLDKYEKNLNDDFVLGYYIHLYTDYLWFKYFMPSISNDNYIYELNGKIKKVAKEQFIVYLYNDYTNLNVELIDEYNLALDIFYEDVPCFDNVIEEIPMNNLKVIVDKAGIIIENSKISKTYMIDVKKVNEFIKYSVEEILNNLHKMNIV